MTVTVTTDRTGPLIADSADPLPFTFQAISAAEIEVYLDDVLVDPNDYTVVLNGDGTGSVVPLDPWDGEVYILSAPSFQQPFTFNRFVPLYPDQIVPPLDRLAKTIVALKNRLLRGLPLIGSVGTGDVGDPASVTQRVADGGQTYWDFSLPRGDQGPAGDVAKAADRTELSETVAISGMVRYLAEGERSGSFVYDGSDLSAQVADDPLQAIYVAKASDPTGASGAWVRRYVGPKDPRWFGAVGNGVTDDHTALQAWLDSGGDLHLPAREFYSSAKLILRKNVVINGEGYTITSLALGYGNQPGSRIRFPAGSAGLEIQAQMTATDVATVAANPPSFFVQEGAVNSRISNIALLGANAGAAVTGLYARTKVHLDNVHVVEFAGKGFDISASSDLSDGNSEYGNANTSTLTRCTALSNGSHGFHLRGRDANVIRLDTCNAQANNGWGFLDESLLGNTYDNCHSAGNTSGSFKQTSAVANCHYTNCYVENGFGNNCDIKYQCVIDGGSLGGSPNAQTTPPAILSGGYLQSAALKLTDAGTGVPNPTGVGGFVYAGLNYGGALGGRGNVGDAALLNRTQTVAAYVPATTTDFHVVGGVDAGSLTTRDGQLRNALGGAIINAIAGGPTYHYSADGSHGFLDSVSNIHTTADNSGNWWLTGNLNVAVGKVYKVNGVQVVGARGAAIADVAMAVAAPTKAEYDALATAFNTLLARVRAATGHGLIA